MNLVPVNRISTSNVTLLICFRFALALVLLSPALTLPQDMAHLPALFNLLVVIYIYLYLRNFLGQVMNVKGFSIPFIILASLLLISSLWTYSSAEYHELVISVAGVLIFLINIWILVKLFLLPAIPYRRYLQWYMSLLMVGSIVSAYLPVVIGRLVNAGSMEFNSAALMINIVEGSANQLPYVPILLMILAYRRTIK